MSLDQLRHLLADTARAVSDAEAHTARAGELLADYHRVVVDAQAQAQPWLPRELGAAVERVEANQARLRVVHELLTSYESRL